MTKFPDFLRWILALQIFIQQGRVAGCQKTIVGNVYRSYQNTIYCTPSSAILHPSNISEVQKIVQQAIQEKRTVKAIGSRHSITDVICTEGIPIAMHNINYTIASDNDTAKVGAGAEMIAVLEFLDKHNRSLIHVPTFGGITVAGAVGTGAHGSSLRHPPSLSDQVLGMTIVDGKGEIRIITEKEDLDAFQVHLGLLGVVIDVTLKTVPLFKMTVHNNIEAEAILLDGRAIQWAQDHDWFEMWWFPSDENVVVSRGNYTSDLSIPGNASTNFIPDESPSTIHIARDAFEFLQGTKDKNGLKVLQKFTQDSLHKTIVGKPPLYTEDGKTIKNPATGYAWRLQQNKCTNKCAWENGENSILPEESAMAFDISELPGIIKTMKSLLAQIKASFVMVGVFIRFSRPSEALMAISHGRQSVHLEWATPMRRNPYVTSRDGIGAYQAILQAMVKNHAGRPHWGKNGLHYLSRQVMNKAVPRSNREAFAKVMKKYDPNGIFLNKFGNRFLDLSDEVNIDPKVTHCALQDYCICSKKQDCSVIQKCNVVDTFSVCQDFGDNLFPSMKATNYDPQNLTSVHKFYSLEAIPKPSNQGKKNPGVFHQKPRPSGFLGVLPVLGV